MTDNAAPTVQAPAPDAGPKSTPASGSQTLKNESSGPSNSQVEEAIPISNLHKGYGAMLPGSATRKVQAAVELNGSIIDESTHSIRHDSHVQLYRADGLSSRPSLMVATIFLVSVVAVVFFLVVLPILWHIKDGNSFEDWLDELIVESVFERRSALCVLGAALPAAGLAACAAHEATKFIVFLPLGSGTVCKKERLSLCKRRD